MSELTDQLLQAILAEVKASNGKQKVGFGYPPKPRYIYANRQYPDALWYFWDGANNTHIPIPQTALTGIIEKLEVEEKEFRGKPDYKLNIHIRAEANYVIQVGYDTLIGKGLLYTFSKIPVEAFRKLITIAVEPGDTEQVLFGRVYNPETGTAVFAPYSDNVDWRQVTQKAINKVKSAHEPQEVAVQ